MVRRSPRVITYSLVALLLQSDVAFALTPVTVSFAVVVDFDKFSSEVTDKERDKITAAFNRIRTEDWCPYVQGFINGRASEEEGTEDEQKALARRRAEQVKQLLDDSGFPKERTYLLAQRSLEFGKSKPRSVTELRFDGFPGHPQCSITPDTNGFRTNN